MNDAIDDLLILVNEIVAGIGEEIVAEKMMSNYGWVNIDPQDIAGDVRTHFQHNVEKEFFDAEMEVIYSEFYNLAADFDYEITTTY